VQGAPSIIRGWQVVGAGAQRVVATELEDRRNAHRAALRADLDDVERSADVRCHVVGARRAAEAALALPVGTGYAIGVGAAPGHGLTDLVAVRGRPTSVSSVITCRRR
jgi:hypothetical protein